MKNIKINEDFKRMIVINLCDAKFSLSVESLGKTCINKNQQQTSHDIVSLQKALASYVRTIEYPPLLD